MNTAVVIAFECQEDAASCDCSWHENLARAEETHPLSHEDIFDALDTWLGEPNTYREFKVRPTLLGRVCVLTDGARTIVESGQHTDSAIESALRTAGAL